MMEIVHCFGLEGLAGVSIEGEEFRQPGSTRTCRIADSLG